MSELYAESSGLEFSLHQPTAWCGLRVALLIAPIASCRSLTKDPVIARKCQQNGLHKNKKKTSRSLHLESFISL
jgi:hypothetical protein